MKIGMSIIYRFDKLYLLHTCVFSSHLYCKILSLTRPGQRLTTRGGRGWPHSPLARASTLPFPPRGQSLTSGLVRKCTISVVSVAVHVNRVVLRAQLRLLLKIEFTESVDYRHANFYKLFLLN